MKELNEKKRKISIAINPEILKLLDDKTSNRSNYLDWILLEYFNKIGSDTSKIKL
jgi:recombinational DNA repair ATPase RecF